MRRCGWWSRSGALAGCYLLLTAEFVAWVQVLIYVGAVVVLLLFGIMLTRAPIGPSANLDSGNRPLALAVAVASAATLVTVVIAGFREAYVELGDPPAGAASEMGASIFRTWVLPFEVLSLLLLAALIGAIDLNLVTFDVWLGDVLHGGQVLTLFVIVIAAAEGGLGLAIVLLVFRNRGTVEVDALRDLADRDAEPVEAAPVPVAPAGTAARPAEPAP